MKPNTTSISAVAFSPDGQRVVLAHAHDLRNWLSIYDLGSALEVNRLSREWRPAHTSHRYLILLEIGSPYPMKPQMWKFGIPNRGKSLILWSIPADVHDLAWHPKRNAIAVASARHLRLYLPMLRARKRASAFAGHQAQVVDVDFNHARRFTYTASVGMETSFCGIWPPARSPLAFEDSPPQCPFSLDDRWLACFPNDGHVGIMGNCCQTCMSHFARTNPTLAAVLYRLCIQSQWSTPGNLS